MDLYAISDQVVALLQQRGRLAYRMLQLQFQLDDEQLAALKEELIDGQRVAVDDGGKVLVWARGGPVASTPASQSGTVAKFTDCTIMTEPTRATPVRARGVGGRVGRSPQGRRE